MVVECTACSKRLPKSAFAKAELNRGGNGRCRGCAQRIKCVGCRIWMLPAQLDSKFTCRRCRENSQVDRLLQTPSDEVTHFGVEHALRLNREAEHEVLLACQRNGVHERCVLQHILDFLRVPYVTTQNGMHYCELCNTTFDELAVTRGSAVRFAVNNDKINWKETPEPRLHVNLDESYRIADMWQSPSGRWFFRALAAPPPTRRESDKDTEATLPHAEEGTSMPSRSRADSFDVSLRGGGFESYWAPLDCTVEGRQTCPLERHLRDERHAAHEAAISSGRLLLISRAAIGLAKKFKEDPLISLGRFKTGLELEDRFCAPAHVETAKKLIRVRDIHIPVKFLRETLIGKKDFLWISPSELRDVEDAYEEKKTRKGGKKDVDKVPEDRLPRRIQA